MSTNRYIEEVNELTTKLRAHLLGQDARLEDLIPQALFDEPESKQANYLADRILFTLSRMDHWFPPKELQCARNWLYEILLFLILECTEEDHTFANLMKIIRLSSTTRMSMFQHPERKLPYPNLAQDRNLPVLLEDLELALLEVLPLYHAISDYDTLSSFC